ncbi:MAG: TldD/PmbA family protein [Oscillospiraceae bacterium]|nr:TldD/PmbA family protein [Oscillospiraceae bacterium]
MEIREIAAFLCDKIRGTGADMGRCTVRRGESTEVYYESGKISMIRSVFSESVSVAVINGQRCGSASVNSFERDELERAVAEAFAASEHALEDEAEGISERTEDVSSDRGIRRPDRGVLYGLLKGLLEDTAREFPKISYDNISVSHRWTEGAVANTNGVMLSESNGLLSYDAMFMARDGENTSSFNYTGAATDDTVTPLIERGELRRLLGESQRQLKTVPVEGKFVGEVILAPSMLEEVVGEVCGLFLEDGVLIDGTSPWKDKLGRQVASPLVNVTMKALCGELPASSAVARDGYPARDAEIIAGGVLKSFLLSRYGAKKTGLARCPGWDGALCVAPGTDRLADMIAGVRRGLLVNRFSGGAPSPNGDFSGVAKNSFLIEDGAVTAAVSETMISGNFAQMLADVSALSAETLNSGGSIVPWARTGGVTISGK